MHKCPNCGMDNKPSANFCGRCGARLPSEAPAEARKPENEAPAARPAPSDRKKNLWKKAAIPALVLIAGVLLFKGMGQLRSCPACDEILGLQQDLQEVLAENEDNTLTFDDYERWE